MRPKLTLTFLPLSLGTNFTKKAKLLTKNQNNDVAVAESVASKCN